MTDLTTTHLQRLLDQSTPGPWTVKENKWDEIIVGNSAGHSRALGEQVRFLFEAGHPEADTEIVALAPDLAQDNLRMRQELKEIRAIWESASDNPDRTSAEQILAAQVVDYINEVLGDHDE